VVAGGRRKPARSSRRQGLLRGVARSCYDLKAAALVALRSSTPARRSAPPAEDDVHRTSLAREQTLRARSQLRTPSPGVLEEVRAEKSRLRSGSSWSYPVPRLTADTRSGRQVASRSMRSPASTTIVATRASGCATLSAGYPASQLRRAVPAQLARVNARDSAPPRPQPAAARGATAAKAPDRLVKIRSILAPICPTPVRITIDRRRVPFHDERSRIRPRLPAICRAHVRRRRSFVDRTLRFEAAPMSCGRSASPAPHNTTLVVPTRSASRATASTRSTVRSPGDRLRLRLDRARRVGAGAPAFESAVRVVVRLRCRAPRSRRFWTRRFRGSTANAAPSRPCVRRMPAEPARGSESAETSAAPLPSIAAAPPAAKTAAGGLTNARASRPRRPRASRSIPATAEHEPGPG